MIVKMMVRMSIFVPTVFTLLLTANLIAQEKINEYKSDLSPNIILVDEAKTLAVNYLGFNKMEGFSAKNNLHSAEKVTIFDDKTPFLNIELNGKEVWKVTFHNVKLSLSNIPGTRDEINRNFVVFIDPETGKLLKIESRYEGNDKDFLPEPSIEHAESQLRSTGEIYLNFPDSGDYVSFYDAVNSYGTLSVKEISAHLVTATRPHDGEIVVWSITFRGITPQIAKGRYGDSVAECYRNYIRNVYDAKTGKLLYWTTIPTVEPVEEK